jgi:hypothetical protein
MKFTFPFAISLLFTFLSFGMSLPFTRSPTFQPTVRPTLPFPTVSPTRFPTFRPTISPTVDDCISVTVGLFDTQRDGWSGNILTMTGSKTDTPEVTLQLPSGVGSQYHYLCLADDVYTVTCCQGSGDYDEISWNMIVSTTADSISGGASAICEETEQTIKVKGSSSYDDDIEPPLSSQEILLLSVVLPIGLSVCICLIVCCCLRGNRWTMSKEVEETVHRTNQLLKSRGGVLPPSRDIPMNPVVPSNTAAAASYSNYSPSSASPMHSSPAGYGGNSSSYATPSAPPQDQSSDVLKNAFPEFYNNQPTSYGYS